MNSMSPPYMAYNFKSERIYFGFNFYRFLNIGSLLYHRYKYHRYLSRICETESFSHAKQNKLCKFIFLYNYVRLF